MLSEEHYDHGKDYLSKQIASLEAVKTAVQDGRLTEAEIDQKLMRILHMKLNKMQIKTNDLQENKRKEFHKLEASIAQKTIILLQKNLWLLPQKDKIICINATPKSSYENIMNSRGIGPNQEKPAFDYFCKELQSLRKETVFLSYEQAQNNVNLEKADAIILVTEDFPLPGEDFDVKAQQAFVRDLSQQYKEKIIIVGLRSSYELSNYPQDVTYLCAYSSRSCSAKAAAQMLNAGRINVENHPPVAVRV